MDEKDIENQIAKEKAAEDSVLGDGTDNPQSESSHFVLIMIILLIFALGAIAYLVTKKKGKTIFASRNEILNKIEKSDQESSKLLIVSSMN